MAGKQGFIVPARKGRGLRLREGQAVKVINTHGTQVVDTWAFSAADPVECMSMEHTRAALDQMRPELGDALVTNRRRPILTLLEDTSPGIHDTLIAACDRYRYQLLGAKEYHDNCTDNLAAALAALGMEATHTPSPFNLFMNREWGDGLALVRRPPRSKPGDHVVLRAELDCIVVFSACPQDILETNGEERTPRDVECRIL